MDHDIGYKARPFSLTQDASNPVTTVVICENTLLRTGISHLLSGTRFVVTSEPSEHEMPGLILLCDRSASDGYAETIAKLKEQYPSTRLVALSDNLDLWTIQEVCTAGLDGLCSTGMPQAAMLKALELVMLGEIFLPISVSLALLNPSSAHRSQTMSAANHPGNVGTKFSNREAQILRLLTKGASNKIIARELGVAEATVKVHVKAILRKAKAANRTQAAMWATQHFSFEAEFQSAEPADTV
jgi:two-component system, NarL family, nitrate/nitrite response regulator NarL